MSTAPLLLSGLAFAFALALGLLLTRALRDRASGLGMLDSRTDERRVHGRPVAAVGGVGIVAAVYGALLLLALLTFLVQSLGGPSPGGAWSGIRGSGLLAVLGGALAMHGLGLVDDARDLSPLTKLAGQVMIAIAVFAAAARLTGFPAPVLGIPKLTLWFAAPLTVLWLVGISNALNLVDGSDGVAGGVAATATLALLAAFAVSGQVAGAIVAAATVGALLAFLRFNRPPASVFLGDGGSLFLGFLLAGLGLAFAHEAAPPLAMALPAVAFGLPVLDMCLAVIRRLLRAQPIWRADRCHVHHRLLDRGDSPRRVAWLLSGVSGAFGLASLALLTGSEQLIGAAALGLTGVVWVLLRRLRMPELAAVRGAIGRGGRWAGLWLRRAFVSGPDPARRTGT